MKYEEMQIIEVVQYVNSELLKDRTMKEIEEADFCVNKGVIQKRLNRKGYVKIDNQFILKENNATNKTTKELQRKKENTTKENTDIIQRKAKKGEEKKVFKSDEIEKLNKLLDLDINVLEKIIQEYTTKKDTKSSIDIKDNSTIVTSIRVNKELYSKLKQRAKENDIKLQDVFFDMMVSYLSK